MSSVIIYRVKKNCRVNGATGVFTWSNDTSCDYTSTPEDVHRFLSLVQRLAVSFANFFPSRGRARAAIRRRRPDEEEGETGTSQKRQSRVHKSPCSRPKKKKIRAKREIKSVAQPPRGGDFPARSNTSVRSILNLSPVSPPLPTLLFFLSAPRFSPRPFDSACVYAARTTESRQQSEKQAAAKDTRSVLAMLYKVVHPDSDNLVSARGCRPTRE